MRAHVSNRGRFLLGRTERGASAIEFALVLPILIMLMFGAFTGALAYSDHLALTNAVREAARMGSAIEYDVDAPATWANDVQTRAVQVYMNGSGTLTASQVCVQLVDSSGPVATPTSQGSSCAGNVPGTPDGVTGDSCVVKVWAAKPAEIKLVAFPDLTFSIGARSVSYYGRTVEDGCRPS